ncbi:putative adenosine monophosphate-protein transferase Fic [Methyloprofundus sp.]|uniref:putative adenosine monophosphate-protein transferase Fic n=1 Tax=Methyloprofundus sp. TaxID=2020875 RepID=UPI003D0EB16C
MDKYDSVNDRYCYLGTSVLKNKLNIKDENKLENAEREITNLTIDNVKYQSPPYDLGYLQSIHSTLFSDLYDWAGCIRDVNISKGGTTFCIFTRIVPEVDKLFLQLTRDKWLIGLSKSELCKKLAEYYCEFNMIHPFREGNGRVQRVFFEHLALSTDYELEWSDVTLNEWIGANIDGVNVNYEPMEAIFIRILS